MSGKKRKQRGKENHGGAVQGKQGIPGSLDLPHCGSGNFISILAGVRGSVAEESAFYFDRQNGSVPFPAAGLPVLA